MSGKTDLAPADGANEARAERVALDALEHHLSPVVEARLADVVRRLRGSWLAGPAQLWSGIHPVRELAETEVDQRVSGALARGFLQFSQFLAGFEVLLLELEHRGVVSEQRLLSLEQLIVQGRHFFRDEIEVAQADHGHGDVLRNPKRGRDDSKLGGVHG